MESLNGRSITDRRYTRSNISVRVLFDTNVFIDVEKSQVIDESYSQLVRLLQGNQHTILIHPSSTKDLNRDKDESRKSIQTSKVGKYSVLTNPPNCGSLFASRGIKCVNEHDKVDCDLLCAVYENAVHLLVTEDVGVHKKAKLLGISDRVFYVQQAVSSFENIHRVPDVSLPNIELVNLYELNSKLKTDSFFESLRVDYAEFDTWFTECAKNGRKAWVSWTKEGDIGALCILKDAVDDIKSGDGKFVGGTALKLCTFKVAAPMLGRKVGELFLKAAFKYAHSKKQAHIFLTVKPGQEQLEKLLGDFGFAAIGENEHAEIVFVKEHPIVPPAGAGDALAYHIRYSPYIMATEKEQAFLVPIRPEYHEILFPEASPTQLSIPLDLEPNHAPKVNAMKLAYICHSSIKNIAPGDTLLFYRTVDKLVTTIGVVETAEHLSELDEILNRVMKRTVYSIGELEDISKKKSLVVLFRLALHLPESLTYKYLESQGINGPYQTIRKLDNKIFRRIIEKAGVQDCFVFG